MTFIKAAALLAACLAVTAHAQVYRAPPITTATDETVDYNACYDGWTWEILASKMWDCYAIKTSLSLTWPADAPGPLTLKAINAYQMDWKQVRKVTPPGGVNKAGIVLNRVSGALSQANSYFVAGDDAGDLTFTAGSGAGARSYHFRYYKCNFGTPAQQHMCLDLNDLRVAAVPITTFYNTPDVGPMSYTIDVAAGQQADATDAVGKGAASPAVKNGTAGEERGILLVLDDKADKLAAAAGGVKDKVAGAKTELKEKAGGGGGGGGTRRLLSA